MVSSSEAASYNADIVSRLSLRFAITCEIDICMQRNLKRVAEVLLGSRLSRAPILAVIYVSRQLGRVASKARLLALAPHARGVTCHWSVEIKHPENITFGHAVIIGPDCTLGAFGRIILGNHVRLSKGVTIETAGLDLSTPPPFRHTSQQITIEDGVWLGTDAIILGGVTIGHGSIIGAGAIVSRNVEPRSIVTTSAMRVRPRGSGQHPK
jgi:maltose O-acetyltransferase